MSKSVSTDWFMGFSGPFPPFSMERAINGQFDLVGDAVMAPASQDGTDCVNRHSTDIGAGACPGTAGPHKSRQCSPGNLALGAGLGRGHREVNQGASFPRDARAGYGTVAPNGVSVACIAEPVGSPSRNLHDSWDYGMPLSG